MKIDFNSTVGAVKPMHATNNGPVVSAKAIQNNTFHPFNDNLNEFKAAGIPYARTHDSSFYARYGMEHTVDVYYVFPNFDADPYDPKNYDFVCTDHYIKGCILAGTKVFYRLGHRIEHEVKKYGTLPPKDFKKWAVICEHIIRHYTEGWADGFKLDMEYWEIWNEPDLCCEPPATSPTWGGTQEEFFELYHVAATHLKTCFPHLKIGGPAIAGDLEWAERFLSQLKAPLDFFSWHCYSHTIKKMFDRTRAVRALLDKYGFKDAESILNEWNYVTDWSGDDIVYSHEQRKKIKGAAFTAAAMCACQYSPVDMLMYYDARPTFWNGMFDSTVVGRVLKGYYPFVMFNALYSLGTCATVSEVEECGYGCAARNENEAAIFATHFNDDDAAESQNFSIDIVGFGTDAGTDVEIYLLDDAHDNTLVGKATYYGERFSLKLDMPNFTCLLVKLKKTA